MTNRSSAPDLPEFITRQLPEGIQRYCLNVHGRSMHVMEIGSGRPVLMQHGNPTWGFLYRNVARAVLGHDVRVILPDLMGLGFSDRVAADQHSIAAHGRWLGAAIDALELDGLVVVCQDWGGPIALRAMADRLDRLAGLVVLNTVLGPPKPTFKPTAFHRLAQTPILSDLIFRGLGFPQRGLFLAQGRRGSISGDVARAYQHPLRGLENNVAPLALARMVPDSMDHPSVASLDIVKRTVEAFSGPSAIVWGDKDPVLGRLRKRTQRMLPDAPCTVTQAGHFLQEEVPGQIGAA
ncbi:MAG: pimeloyl-ACP methyl ester carboxylesterase, partial [Myxococcota bacterium]